MRAEASRSAWLYLVLAARPSAENMSEAELIPLPLPQTQNDSPAHGPCRNEPKTPGMTVLK